MDFTKIARLYFKPVAERTLAWRTQSAKIQQTQLRNLLRKAQHTEMGRKHGYREILNSADPYAAYRSAVPLVGYEDIRAMVMRMISGESDILWPGKCLKYAQSSGTSGGKSKYIPITASALKNCHYKGATDGPAHYLRLNPNSRIFSGKAFMLGGSYASTLEVDNPAVKIGDVSATLISDVNPVINMFRVPDKKTALMPDWLEKLPALVKASMNANITNISGVPSWFLTVIKEVMKTKGVSKISDAWPNLEVFFHGGINFDPYREIYREITDSSKMHFLETYNASEGFFAVQNDFDDPAMLLTIDNEVFYEFIDLSDPNQQPLPLWEVEPGKVYELIITASNGLWRYRIGDTVRVTQTDPVKIRIAGRTKTFINAFGEELMEDNAEKGIGEACRRHNCSVMNYTAAPVFATGKKKGRHQWLIEWQKAPQDCEAFGATLDKELRKINSDYDAKRSHTIFLDPPEIVSLPQGTFNRWLLAAPGGKLGGQRKIPRLSNDRRIADQLLEMI